MNEIRRRPLGAFAPLLAIACSDTTGPGASFEFAEARWTAEGPSHYQYVYNLSCECLVTGPVRLNVENGVVTAFALLPGSFAAGGAPEPAAFPTIDDLFARLRAESGADPVQFDVEYDDELGYPTRASVDARAEVADDEYTFRVSDFVPHGAPLVETGSIAWFPADGGGLRAELTTERGDRLELTATGEFLPVPQTQTLTITGRVVYAGGAAYEFASTRRITPPDDGTAESDARLTGPNGLDARFSTFTTHITVFAGEDSSQEFTAASASGRAALDGSLLGGNGFFELSIDGVAVGTIEQISGLSPDLFGGIEPAGEAELTPELEAAARTIFRAKNATSTGLSKLVQPVF